MKDRTKNCVTPKQDKNQNGAYKRKHENRVMMNNYNRSQKANKLEALLNKATNYIQGKEKSPVKPTKPAIKIGINRKDRRQRNRVS